MKANKASEKLIQLRSNIHLDEPKDHAVREVQFVRVLTAIVDKSDIVSVDIEVSLLPGIPRLEFLGFQGTASADAKLRISAALKNAGYKMPGKRVTVSLGNSMRLNYQEQFDFPIAIGILKATGQVKGLEEYSALGALSLNGDVEAYPHLAALLAVLATKSTKILTTMSYSNTLLVFPTALYPVDNLRDLKKTQAVSVECIDGIPDHNHIDSKKHLAKLKGQHIAVRALQIAAHGRHSLCILGSAGSGKSELLRFLPNLLPDLDEDAWRALLVHYSLAGLEDVFLEQGKRPPFRVIHPGQSRAKILGSKKNGIGEWQLARFGVCFLEEVSSMPASQLALFQELIDKDRIISNENSIGRKYRYDNPNLFNERLLLAAGNPCPCGRYFEKDGSCRCSMGDVQRRLGKLHAAFRERFDLWLILRAPTQEDQKNSISMSEELDIDELKKNLSLAKSVYFDRNEGIIENGDNMKLEVFNFAQSIENKKKLSLRQFRTLINIARTIADLELSKYVEKHHVLEASQYVISDFQDL